MDSKRNDMFCLHNSYTHKIDDTRLRHIFCAFNVLHNTKSSDKRAPLILCYIECENTVVRPNWMLHFVCVDFDKFWETLEDIFTYIKRFLLSSYQLNSKQISNGNNSKIQILIQSSNRPWTFIFYSRSIMYTSKCATTKEIKKKN